MHKNRISQRDTFPGWRNLLTRLRKRPPLEVVTGWSNRLKGGAFCPRHAHASLEIVYHRVGHGVTSTARDSEIFFEEGSVVVYAPHEIHDQKMATHGEDLCLHLQLPPLALHGALYVRHVENPLVLSELESLIGAPLPAGAGARSILNHRATAVFFTLLEAACQTPLDLAPAETHVRRAEEYLRSYFTTIGSLREVALHAGVSADHLRHLYQERRGGTLVRRLNELRVERACSLLTHSDLAIKEIARQCGFRDVYYFSVVFTRLARMSPGRYRHRHRPC